MDLAAVRRQYQSVCLDVADVAVDPVTQFELWYTEVAEVIEEPNAVVLATTAAGRPSVRHVLCKGVDDRGFLFYTNYRSRKGDELADNPYAALVFAWSPVSRQVIVEGPVARVDDARSDAYFASRPRESQLGAWASSQSEPRDSRESLEAAFREAAQRFADRPVPRPPHWGGYVLTAERVEFWQGRPDRLHDRVEYLADGSAWRIRRLDP